LGPWVSPGANSQLGTPFLSLSLVIVVSSALGISVEGEPENPTMDRTTWDEICRRHECRGRWVALDQCSYDESTGKATEGQIVDMDDDLVELCNRLREAELTNCAILFVAGERAA